MESLYVMKNMEFFLKNFNYEFHTAEVQNLNQAQFKLTALVTDSGVRSTVPIKSTRIVT
jgi:hypothetical protein